MQPTVIKAAFKHFQESGIEIDISSKGYALHSPPDTLLPVLLHCGLRSRIMGREIHCYKTVGSTNEVARRLAESGAPEGTLVVSEKQTRGRGRLGRSWHSPSGLGVYFSIVLRPQLDFSKMPALSLVAALSICRSIEYFCKTAVMVKWPNDCQIGGRKVAGILVELSAELDRVSYAVLGIGINVNHQHDNFPPRLRPKATSLAIEMGRKIDRPALLRKFLEDFERSYRSFQRYGFRFIAPELVKRSSVIGKNIVIVIGKQKIQGTALGFDQNGALRVRDKKGVRIFSAGEVSLR